ncbi:GH92 family glycosyl hydrolase [Acidipila sp. EB88]|uniref:GH92 family glycosyl hydrolase n=1 Tax=Acidipila sp. EB88 TaxID=2305226 RepID=UPI000F5D726F|nr:GH92 family glycosyl hydrolase [Acidipila sp. EB88]RRA48265.1 glycoside hydrolase family 92 protein [Acidipila sp. EB88]
MKKSASESLGSANGVAATGGASRRQFLKVSGVVTAATFLGNDSTAMAAAETHMDGAAAASAAGAATASPVELVNLLQGTQSTPRFSHGNTLPIAATPFGMAHWTIQTDAGTPWFFQPWNRRTQGFRCTHQLSPWLYDYGSATFLPVSGSVTPDASARASSYIPEQAKLAPNSLELFLLRYRARVELVPTTRCSVITAKYDAALPGDTPRKPGLIIDIPKLAGEVQQHKESRRIEFASSESSGGTPDGFACYYVVEFAEVWESCVVAEHKDRSGAVRQTVAVSFAQGEHLEARIGTSFISAEQALFNLEQEVGKADAATLKQRAAEEWNGMLGRIAIEGASLEQQRTFYSCLYRTMLFPRTFHEPVPQGSGVHHYSAFNGKVEPGVMYADHGYWDVYRAWYPLASLLFPEKLAEILQAWVNAYKEGGWFPQFPAPGYRACMSGSLIDSLFADAIVKNVGMFDREVVFAGLKKHATQVGDPDKGFGRVGVTEYMQLHYVPADKIEQSVAETADAAYGDFCIAQIARSLGKTDDYAHFMERSKYWRNIYDTEVKFFRGKNADGSWLAPFNSFVWGSPYEEGSAWQHRWDAPHAIADVMESMGGKAAAAEALEQMLATPPIFEVGVYGSEIHEMSEMAAVPFGQYAHSNQPSHHMLYLFAHAGKAERLQFWARRVMNELYSPDGFAGDEDTGSMAAWYVLSALGIYQVCPAVPEYTFGSPLFQRATVQLAGGKKLVVEAPGNTPETVYVRSVRFNGKQQAGPVIAHDALVRGGTLEFAMSAQKQG